MNHIPFPEINQFHQTKKLIHSKSQFVGLDANGDPVYDSSKTLPKIDYVATTKSHGTNAAIQILGNQVVTQSRSRIITSEDDNVGFAAWVNTFSVDVWIKIKSEILKANNLSNKDLIIYGEWCGKGINAGCAVHQLEKMFVIFAAKETYEEAPWLDLSSVDLSSFNEYKTFNIFQFGSWRFSINYNDPVDVAEKVNKIIELTLEIEKECPIGKFFGVSGVGEGLVAVPVTKEWNSSRYWFKSKGSEHSKSRVKKLPTQNVEKVKDIQDYVSRNVSEERLTQAWNWLKENKKPQDRTSTSDFLRWMVNDIEKEEKDQREASGLTEKDVNSAISHASRNWFFQKVDSQL
jgi:hypothetical protein